MKILRAAAAISGVLVGLVGCVTAQSPSGGTGGAVVLGSGIRLSPEEREAIGQKIWVNECAGTEKGLTSWNNGEHFASLGIGHFIWYSAGNDAIYEESFPSLIHFLSSRGVALPSWLKVGMDCPWTTREAFMADFESPQMRELRAFLVNTVPEQAEFAALRMESALPKMLEVAAPEDRERVRAQFYRVAGRPHGVYALMDYVNFKGEGINPGERYRGQGWGLLQVLATMNPQAADSQAEFAASSRRVLERRVANAPKDETRWLAGWRNRCASYAKPL